MINNYSKINYWAAIVSRGHAGPVEVTLGPATATYNTRYMGGKLPDLYLGQYF